MQAFGLTRIMSGDTVSDYYAIACSYACHLSDELIGKPFDRALQNAFAYRRGGCGIVGDLGCGPSHVAAYLNAKGLSVEGVDYSAGMLAKASRAHPDAQGTVPACAISGIIRGKMDWKFKCGIGGGAS